MMSEIYVFRRGAPRRILAHSLTVLAVGPTLNVLN